MSIREGVDVSSYQGAPGQWRAEAGQIGFAAVKLTELGADGTRYVNPDAAADWEWLGQNGICRIAYLFAHPGADPAETASFFTGELRKLGLNEDDMVAVDLEVTDGREPGHVAGWAQTVIRYLRHDLARRPLLYTFLSFAQEGNCDGLAEHTSLWISDPSSPMGRPRVPAPWDRWAIHQWSTSGPIDRDFTAWHHPQQMAEHLGRSDPAHRIIDREPRVRKHRLRKASLAVAGAARQTVRAEPVMVAGLGAGFLSAALVFAQRHLGLHLTAVQSGAALTVITAVAGAVAAAVTRPVRAGAITAALSALAVAAAAFGLHLPARLIGYEMPLASLIVGLILRLHVSPAGSPAKAAAPGSVMLPTLTQRFEADFGQVHQALDAVLAHARQAAGAVSAVIPAAPAAVPGPAAPPAETAPAAAAPVPPA